MGPCSHAPIMNVPKGLWKKWEGTTKKEAAERVVRNARLRFAGGRSGSTRWAREADKGDRPKWGSMRKKVILPAVFANGKTIGPAKRSRGFGAHYKKVRLL